MDVYITPFLWYYKHLWMSRYAFRWDIHWAALSRQGMLDTVYSALSRIFPAACSHFCQLLVSAPPSGRRQSNWGREERPGGGHRVARMHASADTYLRWTDVIQGVPPPKKRVHVYPLVSIFKIRRNMTFEQNEKNCTDSNPQSASNKMT